MFFSPINIILCLYSAIFYKLTSFICAYIYILFFLFQDKWVIRNSSTEGKSVIGYYDGETRRSVVMGTQLMKKKLSQTAVANLKAGSIQLPLTEFVPNFSAGKSKL